MSKESIPFDTNKVKPDEEDTQKQTKYLPQITNRFYALLQGDYRLRKRHKTLHPNGSFYGTNERYATEMNVSISTIQRSKKRLATAKKIRYITHQGRGMATVYWVLPPDRRNPTVENIHRSNTKNELPETIRTCARLFGREHAWQFFSERGIPNTELTKHLAV